MAEPDRPEELGSAVAILDVGPVTSMKISRPSVSVTTWRWQVRFLQEGVAGLLRHKTLSPKQTDADASVSRATYSSKRDVSSRSRS
jgi:hypothetical protein